MHDVVILIREIILNGWLGIDTDSKEIKQKHTALRKALFVDFKIPPKAKAVKVDLSTIIKEGTASMKAYLELKFWADNHLERKLKE